MRFGFIPVLVAIFLASACSKSDPTMVSGDVALHLDAQTSASLGLPDGTTLPNGDTATANGQVVGHCVVGDVATDVELERTATASAPVTGLAWIKVHLDSPEAPQVAHVLADYEGELFEADCDVDSFVRSRRDGVLDLSIGGCELMTPTPSANTTTIDVDLSFEGCTDH